MNGRGLKKPAVLVPDDVRGLLDKLSKAHLMDIAYSLAGRLAESADDAQQVMAVLAHESEVVSGYRGDVSLLVHAERRAVQP